MKTSTEMISSLRRVALASRLFLAIAVVSLCAAVALLAWHQGAFTRTIRVFFYAGTADGMHRGMAVKLIGFKVGYLDEIAIDNDLRVKVQIRLDRKYVPMIDAGATIRLAREGVIGANVLEVRPGSGDSGPVTRSAVLRYEREPSLEGALTALVDQATPIVSDARQLAAYFNDPDSDFRQAMRNASQAAARLGQASDALQKLIVNAEGRLERGEARVTATLDSAQALLRSTGESLAVLDSSLKKVDAALPGITAKLDQGLENFRVTSEAMRNMATGELPGLVGETSTLVSDTGEVVRGARQAWPVRNLVQPRQELLLRFDSGGGLGTEPVEKGREK